MENESALKVLEHKLNDYAYGYEDFKVPFELMVNITLSEYRALVKSDAVSRAEIERHKKDAETYKEIADKLNKENVLLKGQLQATVKDNNEIKCEVIEEALDLVNVVVTQLKSENNEVDWGFTGGAAVAFTRVRKALRAKKEEYKNEQLNNI